ncbi:MAG: hypothetical protein RBS29_07925 [Bacteroidales bacterium]|jgi:hypothetical protein|nr:hypothetical protein [Bacteroidales bacterium]
MSQINSKFQIYNKLKNQYPVFHFDSYTYSYSNQNLKIQFHFRTEELEFTPQVELKFGKYISNNQISNNLDGFIFQIGMIELISYWKCVGAPIIHIHPFRLTERMENWWRKLYYKGLGEFFYQNNIVVNPDDFIHFKYDEDSPHVKDLVYPRIKDSSHVIVPIGGGKDSVVTLEHYLPIKNVIPLIMNPRGATLECARIAGFQTLHDIFIIEREIDPLLLKLNDQGYLNGHTPFSALLAFYTGLAGYITNTRKIALSNESSANEATIPGTDINHQYSKSLEFELDFRFYVDKYMNQCVDYFSYLRPYSELQIAQMFANYPQYHHVFRSCNAGSKKNIWCCNCSKCLFAYIILSPFIEDSKMIQIFGEDLLNKQQLITYFDELTGIAPNKPFECVGTIDEVNEALHMISKTREDKFLVQRFLNQIK